MSDQSLSNANDEIFSTALSLARATVRPVRVEIFELFFLLQESFHFSQLEKLLDIDSEFVALLKLEVRPYNNKDTIEEYRMVLYRWRNPFQLF